jgi:hypothetical protein
VPNKALQAMRYRARLSFRVRLQNSARRKSFAACDTMLSSVSRRASRQPEGETQQASHAIHARNDDQWGLTQTTETLGAIARDVQDETRVYALMAQSAALAHEIGIPWWEGGLLAELVQLALTAGRLDEAEMHARASLALAEQVRDRAGRVFGVGLLARVALECGQVERAGCLWGAIEDEDAGAPLGGWRRHRQTCAVRMRDAAGPEFERGYAEGRRLTLDAAVTVALESADGYCSRESG